MEKSHQQTTHDRTAGVVILPALFVLLATAAFLAIVYLKHDTYRNWRYEYDLFSFNTAITETARGNIGLDFEYGNTFGDHAYLFVLLLAPLKFVLGTRMIYLLLVLSAVAYYLSNLVFYFVVRKRTTPLLAFMLGMVNLVGFTYILYGLEEKNWGMHPDTMAGFLLNAVTCLYLLLEDKDLSGWRRTIAQALLAGFLIAFLSLKEEMVILGFIFFFTAAVLKRSKAFALAAAGMLVLLILEFQFIEYFRTPYNRTNSRLIGGYIDYLRQTDLRGFFISPATQVKAQYYYWAFFSVCLVVMALVSALAKRLNGFIVALFLTGIAKLLISLVTFDLDLYTWHNLPGVTMMVCAILLQIAALRQRRPRIAAGLASVLLAGSILCFIFSDVPYYDWLMYKNFDKRRRVQVVTNDLHAVQQLVDPMRLTGVPPFSAKQWGAYRNNYYDFGFNELPDGLFDYLVIPVSEDAMSLSLIFESPDPTDDIWLSFAEVYRNEHYVLLERYHILPKDQEIRQYFSRFGLNPSLPAPRQ